MTGWNLRFSQCSKFGLRLTVNGVRGRFSVLVPLE
jgi:hypothetical protein